MTTVAELTIEMSANVARLQADMQRAVGTVQGATAKMQAAAEMAGKALGLIGIGLSVAAFTGFIRKAIDAADAVGKLSNSTGIATRDLAGLQMAYEQAGLSSDVFATSAAKLSRHMADGSKELEAMGVKARNTDGSLRNTKDVLYDVADKFAGYADGAGKAALAQELFGKSGAQMIPLLNGGAEAMRGMQEMAEKLGLTIEQDTADKAAAFNDNLDTLQRGLGGIATRVAAELLPTLSTLSGEFLTAATESGALEGAATTLSTALKLLYSAGVFVVQAFSAVGKTVGLLFAQIAAALKGDFSGAIAMGRDWSADMKSDWSGTAKTISTVWNSAGNSAMDSMSKLGGAAKAQAPNMAAIKNAAAGSAKAADEALKQYESIMQAVRERIKLSEQELAAGQPLTAAQKAEIKVLETLNGIKGKVNATQRLAIELDLAEAKAKELLVEQQHANVTAAKELAAEETKRVAALEGTLAGMAEQNRRMAEEVQLIGLSTEAQRAILTARRLSVIAIKEEQLARMQNATGMSREQIALEEEIRLLKERNTLMGDESAAQDRNAAQQASIAQFKDLWGSIDKTAHDTFVNIFQGGQDTFSKLKNTAKSVFFDWLYQMTLKKWLFNFTVAATGTASGVAQAAMGGQGGSMGMASNLMSAGSSLASVGGQVIGGTMSIANGLGTVAANATGSGITGLLATNGAYGTAAAGSGAGVMGALGAMGPAGWAALAGLAVVAVLASTKGDKRFGSAYQYDAANDSRINGKDFLDGGQRYGVGGQFSSFNAAGGRIIGGPNSGVDFDKASGIQAITIDSINTLLKRIGSKDFIAGFGSGFESSEKGKGFSYAGGRLSSGSEFGTNQGVGYLNNRGSMTNEEAMKSYLTELKQATLQALQSAADVPKSIADTLNGVDVNSLNDQALDGLTAAIDKVMSEVEGFQSAVQGIPFEQLKNLSFDAASGLIAAAGGLEQLNAGLTGYVENFMTDGARRALKFKQIADALNAAGANLTIDQVSAATRKDFAAFVGQIDPTTDAGAKLFAAMLSVQEGFAALTPELISVAGVTAGLPQIIIDGMKSGDAVGAGALFAETLISGVRDALYGGFAQQITSIISDQLVTPLVTALATGASISEAVSGAAIDAMVAQASAAAQALNAILSNASFQSAMAQISASVSSAVSGSISAAGAKPSGGNERRAGFSADGSYYAGAAGGGASLSEINSLKDNSAASSIASAWASITDSIWGEVKRIRGLIEGAGQDGYAAAQARFAIASAQAKAGDEAAYKALPELSRAMLDLAENNTSTLIELQRIRAQTAASLTTTANGVSAAQGLKLPSFAVGTDYVPRDMLAMIHQGERITPRAFNPAAGNSGGNNADMADALRKMADRLDAIEANTRSTAQSGASTNRLVDRVTRGGNAMQTETAGA